MCELNTLFNLTSADAIIQIYLSEKGRKDQEPIQSSTTPDPKFHMGK